MKTIVIFNEIPEAINYIVVDGDQTWLEGLYINGVISPEKQDEIYEFLYNEEGALKHPKFLNFNLAMESIQASLFGRLAQYGVDYLVIECGWYV